MKNLFGVYKDMVSDVPFVITKKGIFSTVFDRTHTYLIHTEILASKLETFVLNGPEKLTLCANSRELHRILNTSNSDDVMVIFIEKQDYCEGIVSNLGIQFQNRKLNMCFNHKLRLMDPDPEQLHFPHINYNTVISMPTNTFQKLVRNLALFSERIEIISDRSELRFQCEGKHDSICLVMIDDTDDQSAGLDPNPSYSVFDSIESNNTSVTNTTTATTNTEDDLSAFSDAAAATADKMRIGVMKVPEGIVQGEYSIRILLHFIKCTSLSRMMELRLGNDMPLIVKYGISNIGTIQLCVSPLPATI